MIPRRSVLWVTALCLVSTGATTKSQDVPPPPVNENPINPLVAKEEMIRDRILRLEDRMFRLRESLLETEPENAARLAAALERSGELGVKERVEQLLELLADGSRLDLAGESEQALIHDLQAVMGVLAEQYDDEEARQDAIDQLEEFKAELGEIIGRQRAHRSAAERATQGNNRAGRMEDAIRQLDDIIQREQSAKDQAGRLDGQDAEAAAEVAQEQNDIGQATKALAEAVRQLSEAGGADSSTPESPELEGESSSPGGSSPSDANGGLQEAAEELDSAQEEMGQAAKNLNQGDPAAAVEDQDRALEELRRARHRLEEAKRAVEEQDRVGELAQEQRETADQTGALAEKMQGGQQGQPQGGQQGDQQPGQSGGQQEGSQQEPAPGQQQVQRAQQHMEDAAKDLEESEPGPATRDQDQALAELEEAMAELEEALRQLRQEEQEEILRDLMSRFREMLAAQLTINTGTRELHAVGQGNFTRAEELRAAELSHTQGEVAGEAASCLHILDEEGTTVVFPAILEQLSEDMETVADRLARLNVGLLTQAIEDEIVATLEDIIQAIERKQQEMEAQQMAGEMMEAGDQPLLPTSAELKLLRAAQIRVNQRTQAIDEAGAAGTEPAQDLAAVTRKVAQRQGEVAETAADLRDMENQN